MLRSGPCKQLVVLGVGGGGGGLGVRAVAVAGTTRPSVAPGLLPRTGWARHGGFSLSASSSSSTPTSSPQALAESQRAAGKRLAGGGGGGPSAQSRPLLQAPVGAFPTNASPAPAPAQSVRQATPAPAAAQSVRLATPAPAPTQAVRLATPPPRSAVAQPNEALRQRPPAPTLGKSALPAGHSGSASSASKPGGVSVRAGAPSQNGGVGQLGPRPGPPPSQGPPRVGPSAELGAQAPRFPGRELRGAAPTGSRASPPPTSQAQPQKVVAGAAPTVPKPQAAAPSVGVSGRASLNKGKAAAPQAPPRQQQQQASPSNQSFTNIAARRHHF